MCRFLLVKSATSIVPEDLLIQFAKACEKSKALDGDWQGDGWGAAWIDKSGNWQEYKSLHPIWEEREKFSGFPKTNIFLSHARSASFPQHKGVVEFNQPFIRGAYAFVFNGLLKGVRLSNIEGKIGAQKIWSLLQKELQVSPPDQALVNVRNLLKAHSQEIIALNMGLATKKQIYSLNYFTQHPEYYTLYHDTLRAVEVICSEKLPL